MTTSRAVGRTSARPACARARARAGALVALLVGHVAAGCAPLRVVDEAALRRCAPQTLAVLPFECAVKDRGARADLQVAALGEAARQRLATTTWLVSAPAEVDARLTALRFDPSRVTTGLLERSSPDGAALLAALLRWRHPGAQVDVEVEPEALAATDDQAALALRAGALCDALGVDAVLVGRITGLSNIEGGVVFAQTIEGDVRMLGADGSLLARVERTERVIGGLLPDSTQSVRAIKDTIANSSDEGFVRLAERWAESLVRDLPAPPKPRALVPPRIVSATLRAPDGRAAFAPGDALEVEVEADPGLVATADLTDGARGVPLVEETPGHYRGAWRVQPGERASERPSVLVVDRFGAGCTRPLAERPLSLEVAAIAPLVRRVTVTPEGTRLAWGAVPGVTSYRVYAVGPRGAPRLLGEVPPASASSAEVSVVVPSPSPGERLAIASVRASGLGPLAFAPAPEADAATTAHQRATR